MITASQKCDNCMHSDVCSKKEFYNKFIKEISNVVVDGDNECIRMAEDCKDVIIDVKCKYYKAVEAIIRTVTACSTGSKLLESK